MEHVDQNLTREEEAQAQLARTGVSSRVAVFLIVGFLATVLAEPIIQHFVEIHQYAIGERHSPWPRAYDLVRERGATARAMRSAANQKSDAYDGALAANEVLAARLHAWQDQIKEDSALGLAVRPGAPALLARLGSGGENVLVGRDGWLFYRPEIENLTHRILLDASHIMAVDRKMREMGIRLIVMPTPSKAMIQTAKFAAGPWPEAGLENPEYRRVIEQLKVAGVQVFELPRQKPLMGEPRYLERDTHWRPEEMQRYATLLAGEIGVNGNTAFGSSATTVSNTGDLAVMIGSSAVQTVAIHGVAGWNSKDSSVLLVGDSYTNIYTDESMGWGKDAGLGPQLAYCLHEPVDCIAINGGGAIDQAMGRLQGKRVVIWQIAAREFAQRGKP